MPSCTPSSRHIYWFLAAALVAVAAQGCAQINSSTRDDYRSAGVEKVDLDPTYESQVTTRLIGGDDFSEAKLEVEAQRLKTCRRQTVKLREKVVHTTNEIDNTAVVTSTALIGAASFACAGAHFSGSGCISKSDDETDENVPLTQGENQGWGAAFGVLGATAVVTVLADLIRAADHTEVVTTERQPMHTEEEACGSEPNGSAVVKVYSPGDGGSPFTVRTGSNGKALIPLTKLALENISAGDSIGRVVVAGDELEGEPFPSRWTDSKRDYYDRLLLGEARASGTVDAYLDYLRAFPDGTGARQAHLDLQALVIKRAVPDLLTSYLVEFEDHPLVRARAEELRDRLRSLQVADAYEQYVEKWELEGEAEPVELHDAKAAAKLRDRLFQFHQDRLEHARDDDADFKTMKVNYEASVQLAPSPAREKLVRDTLSEHLMSRAEELREQEQVVPGTEVLTLYEEAAEWAGSANTEAEARGAALEFALATFDELLPEQLQEEETARQLEFLLRQAEQHARSNEQKERVEQARTTYADRAVLGLLADTKQRAEESDRPADPDVLSSFERALEMAGSEEVKARIRGDYVKYIAKSLREQANRVVRDDFSSNHKLDESLVQSGLDVAQTSREEDFVRIGWVNACADLAEHIATRSDPDQLIGWMGGIELAKQHATSAASKKQLAHRKRQIERDLHKRFPPSKLENLQQAAAIYPPTIDASDTSAVQSALSSPKGNRGERVVLKLDVQRSVGGKYLAETDDGQLVFIYSSNAHAKSQLRTGRNVGVLATIDGAIPYRRDGKRIYLPRLDVIWAAR